MGIIVELLLNFSFIYRIMGTSFVMNLRIWTSFMMDKMSIKEVMMKNMKLVVSILLLLAVSMEIKTSGYLMMAMKTINRRRLKKREVRNSALRARTLWSMSCILERLIGEVTMASYSDYYLS